jgi:DNA polymerase delta subunit 1
MVDFGDIALQDIVRLQRDAAKRCNAEMKKPNNLDPESVKVSAVYLAPKMYASMEILTGDIKPTDRLADAFKKAKLSCKGLQSKRRDNALIGSETQYAALKLILKDGNVQGAVDYVKERISDVLMDRVDLSKYVISKGLSKTDAEYKKGGTVQLHTALKERMAARAKTTGELVPETGDRVPFIMRARSKDEKSSDCSEDPLYAQKNRVPIDKTYYIRKQIMAGTLKVFTAVWEAHRISEIKSMTSMSEKKLRTFRAYEELFAPSLPHMLQKKVRKIGDVQGIEVFAVALPQCLYVGCGVLLSDPKGSQILCPYHQDDYQDAKVLLDEQKESLEHIRDTAWARCRTCAGGWFDEVTCANTTCDNYFHRDRAVMDIEDLEKDQIRFTKFKPKNNNTLSKPKSAKTIEAQEEKKIEKSKRLKNGDISCFFKKK